MNVNTNCNRLWCNRCFLLLWAAAAANGSSSGMHMAWEPLYEFTLAPGEALFFPPSWVHATYNLNSSAGLGPEEVGVLLVGLLIMRDFVLNPSNVSQSQTEGLVYAVCVHQAAVEAAAGCSASVSLQLRYPAATTFVRDFAPRLNRAVESHFCFAHWSVSQAVHAASLHLWSPHMLVSPSHWRHSSTGMACWCNFWCGCVLAGRPSSLVTSTESAGSVARYIRLASSLLRQEFVES
jgi:hypothetical protein